MFKYLKPESIKNFFKVRDKQGNLDWDQVVATTIQTLLMLLTFTVVVFVLWKVGVI